MRRAVRIKSSINKHKLAPIKEFAIEYNRCVNYFIRKLWSNNIMSGKFLDKEFTDVGNRFKLTARLIQCAGKQALQIVKSQRKKSKRQQRMPRFKKLVTELDTRFWEFSEVENSFEWIKFHSGFKYYIPFNRTVMWNRWVDRGFTLSKSIRLIVKGSNLYIDFIFEKENPLLKTKGDIIGIDLGYVDIGRCSDGQILGQNTNTLIKSFDKWEKNTHKQITDYCYSELKKLDLTGIKQVTIENLKSVKSRTRGKFSRKHNRRMSHWLYAKVTNWLERYCEENGVRLEKVSPYKTSQYCRICNNWDRRNRNGVVFKCVHCGHTDNADTNASQNIRLLGLAGVYSLRSLQANLKVANKCP